MLRSRISNLQQYHFNNNTRSKIARSSNTLDDKKASSRKGFKWVGCWIITGLCAIFLVMVIHPSILVTVNPSQQGATPKLVARRGNIPQLHSLPVAFDGLIQRAKTQQTHCQDLGMNDPKQPYDMNGHTAHLSSFGFLHDLKHYLSSEELSNERRDLECVLPPEVECDETQFSVIFMAHNPDRLSKILNQIRVFQQEFNGMVKEVVVVWNGPSPQVLQSTPFGKQLLHNELVRIEYPLEHGFPNDLFNRYHPRLAIKTKAILYYDDDGPFYSYQAIVGGFELWKRNANAQVGAMARKLDFSPRQLNEQQGTIASSKTSSMGGANNSPLLPDRFFISHCPSDQIRYNYNEFAQFGAKMVLPSGSFLHSNYLPCLWHPLFQPLRTFIQEHPVHPDDGTVSMLIAQMSGRAPKVYSRRIKNREPADAAATTRRKLQEGSPTPMNHSTTLRMSEETRLLGRDVPNVDRRRLMDGINWDAPGAHAQKMDWGKLRSDVANSLARYFGSVNSGSLGWCYGTEYQHGENCEPDQAKVGMVPWLNLDHTIRKACP